MTPEEVAMQITLSAIEHKFVTANAPATGKTGKDFEKDYNDYAANEISRFYSTVFETVNGLMYGSGNSKVQ